MLAMSSDDFEVRHHRHVLKIVAVQLELTLACSPRTALVRCRRRH